MFAWFGAKPQDNSLLCWGCRAIFQRGELDILFDRQGIQIDGKCPTEDLKGEVKDRWEQFASTINESVLPTLRQLAKLFSNDSKDHYIKHFEWPHDDSLVMVAMGSPNASYGYFYISVSLVRKTDAVDEHKCEEQLRQERYEQRQREAEAENERLRPLIRAQMREQRRQALVTRMEVEERIVGRHPKQDGQTLVAGDYVEIEANQGFRPAFVLAVGEGDDAHMALVEYFMPMGKRLYRLLNMRNHDDNRSASEKSLPKKWKRRIDEQLAEEQPEPAA